jgi:polar amino acid transport system substrate-binding protein
MKRALFILSVWLAVQTNLAATNVLRWGADPDSNAPYSFYGTQNQLTGFEYEIINAVANYLGRKAQFVQNDWDGLIPGLERDLYDCVICGIEITPEKSEQVLFSDPYYVTFEQYVSRRGSSQIRSLQDLRGQQIGTLSQTAALHLLESVPGIGVKTYDQEVNAYQDVVNGRLNGVLLDFPIAKYYAGPNPALQFDGPPFGTVLYGIAIKKDNYFLQQEINRGLAEIVRTGRLREILSHWGLWTPKVADHFNQPIKPSGPGVEYDGFAISHAESAGLWSRIVRFAEFWPLLLKATILTLEVSIFGMTLAILLGFSLAIIRVFGPLPARWLAALYIEVVRGTPLLIQLFIIFYGLPNLGIKLSPFVAGVLGLGLNYAAYEAENYRAGLLAIPPGQMEAARALGMTQFQGLRAVVIPQSFRLVLPPVTNDFISLLKDSSLISMVTLVELTGAYNRIATQTFDYFGTGLLIAAIYLVIGLPFVRLARFTEERLSVDKRPAGQRPGLLPVLRPKPAAVIRL